MISGINHTAISTGDMERALRFYRDLLGFEEVFSAKWDVGSTGADEMTGLKDTSGRVVMLKAGNTHLELFQYETPESKTMDPNRPVCDHGITHICLEVSNLAQEYERLKGAGMIFHCPPRETGGGNLATYGRDPDGNVLELTEIVDMTKVEIKGS